MSEGDWKQLARLFSGEIAQDVYASVTVQGAAHSQRALLTACFGLYPNARLQLMGNTETDGGGIAQMVRSIPRYSLTDEQAAQDAQITDLSPSDQGGRAAHQVLLMLAQGATEPLGLPTCFFTHLLVADDETSKIVFWHPRTVPARWALHLFQTTLAEDE